MTRLQECLMHNLQYYRKLRGYTQEQLAEKVNTSVNYMGLVERGKNAPSFLMIERIADALEIDSTSLFAPVEQTAHLTTLKALLLDGLQEFIEQAFAEESIVKKSQTICQTESPRVPDKACAPS